MLDSGVIYKASAGETFDSIALSAYGDEKYSAEILMMNPKICRIQVFVGGEQIKLPVIEITEYDGIPEYEPSRAPWKR